MRVLILGGGGREHAIAWKIAKSSSCNKLFVAPGNAGTKDIATNIDFDITDFEKIKSFVLKENVGLVIVGPEDPLVKGIYDFFLNECFKDNDDEERFVETRRDFVYIACVVAMQAKCGLIKMEVTPKRDSVSYPHKSWNEVVAKDAENFAIWNPVLKH